MVFFALFFLFKHSTLQVIDRRPLAMNIVRLSPIFKVVKISEIEKTVDGNSYCFLINRHKQRILRLEIRTNIDFIGNIFKIKYLEK